MDGQTDARIDGWMDGRAGRWTHGRTIGSDEQVEQDRRTDRWTDGQPASWINAWTHEVTGRRMNGGRVDGRTGACTNRWTADEENELDGQSDGNPE